MILRPFGFCAVVPGYYLVCYNKKDTQDEAREAVVPGYYLVCYNDVFNVSLDPAAVVPGYYLVCYNPTRQQRQQERL